MTLLVQFRRCDGSTSGSGVDRYDPNSRFLMRVLQKAYTDSCSARAPKRNCLYSRAPRSHRERGHTSSRHAHSGLSGNIPLPSQRSAGVTILLSIVNYLKISCPGLGVISYFASSVLVHPRLPHVADVDPFDVEFPHVAQL
jgi:hypothetical protein